MNQTKGTLLFNIKRSNEQPVRASPPPHRQTLLQQVSAHPAALWYFYGPFCSGHFNPFKNFFFTMDLDSDYYSFRCEDTNGL